MEKKKNIFEVSVEFTKEEFENAIDKAFDKKKNDIKMDGFRKGKVPKDLYIKKAGKESLYMDAIDVLLPEAYDRVFKDGKYQPIIDPKVDLKKMDENGVEFLFTITTMPEVKISKYTGLEVKKPNVKVTKAEVEKEIESLLEKYSELEIKENGAVENKDIAVIDFEGFKDKVAFEGGKGENYSLEIGSNTFIPGFEEQLIGMKTGEEKEINVTFPEEYQAEELKGAKATFKVKVNEIKTKVQRELDKDFFEDLGMEGVNSKETLEEEIKANIKAHKEMDAENEYIDALLKAVAKNTKVDIPEELIQDEITHMIKRFEQQIKMQGISLDVYYEITRSKEEDLRNNMKEEATNHILYRFILDTIKEKEKITVEEKEVEEEFEKLAKQYNVSTEEIKKMYGDIHMMSYELEARKVINFLKENN